MKTKKLLTILICLLVLIIPSFVDAASLNKTSIELEEDKTETLTVTGLEDGQTVVWSTTASDKATVTDGVVTAKGEGNATIKAEIRNGETLVDTLECSVTVTAKAVEKPVEKEPDYSLKTLTITGGTLDKTFSAKTLAYTVSVTDKSKFKINATLADTENAKLMIGDYKDIKNNKIVKVVVTDKDGSPKTTYAITLSVPANNTNLASLKIENYAFNEAFNKDTTRYTVTVGYDVTEITLSATAEDASSTISGTGTKTNLEVGGNTFKIKVTNGDDSKTYNVFVTREEEAKKESKKNTTKINSTSKTDDLFDIPDVDDPDSPLSIIIITLGSFVLFSIGGFGIYFYIKTSPKRLKKEVMKMKKNEEESPIVEINNPVDEPTKEFK